MRLRHAAADLSLDDGRVHRQTAVLDDDVAVDGDQAGLDVDLDSATWVPPDQPLCPPS